MSATCRCLADESRQDLIQIKATGVIPLQSSSKPWRKPLAGHRRFILFARFLEGPVPHCFKFLPGSLLSGLFRCRTVLQCRMVKLRARYLFDACQGRAVPGKGYGRQTAGPMPPTTRRSFP